MTKLDDISRLAKNARIKDSISATRSKRKSQQAYVRKVKVVKAKCSKAQLEALSRVFLEAKWLYNTCLAWMNDESCKDKRYPSEYKKTQDLSCGQVKLPDGTFDDRELFQLGSQLKQGILNRMDSSIVALAKAREKGRKIGGLKFTSKISSIPLMQYGITYKIKSQHKVKIQGIPGDLYIRGLEQIPDDADIASANLLDEGGSYYIAITYYIDKGVHDNKKNSYSKQEPIGIDMGVSCAITTSDGDKIDCYIEESPRLKKLQRSLKRKQKGSKSYWKCRQAIQREYVKLSNKKDDLANKVVHDLTEHSHIYMQDEALPAWKTNFGKKIHHSILGRVKARLIEHPRVTVLKRSVATTQTCPHCFEKTKITLSDRTFTCEVCGYSQDRDVHAANNMILLSQIEANIKIGQGLSEFKPVERATSGSDQVDILSTVIADK